MLRYCYSCCLLCLGFLWVSFTLLFIFFDVYMCSLVASLLERPEPAGALGFGV